MQNEMCSSYSEGLYYFVFSKTLSYTINTEAGEPLVGVHATPTSHRTLKIIHFRKELQ